MKKALVVLSGGQDSTTCLFWAKQEFDEVHALTFNYGQKHSLELGSARNVAKLAGVRSHHLTIVGSILDSTSPLVNPSFEVEQYASAEVLPGGLEKTFVPMRNALFLVLAANKAVALGCTEIVTGVCQEDFGGYPDCRQTFITSTERMINEALGTTNGCSCGAPDCTVPYYTIHTPLMDLTKAASVNLAASLPGCLEALAYSHTCYNGVFPPCGKCHACLLREKGFVQAGLDDPLKVRAIREGACRAPYSVVGGPVTGRFSSTSMNLSNEPKSEVEK